MAPTYGEFPGVNVSVRGGSNTPPAARGKGLDEEEYQLVTVCIWMTLETDGGAWGIDQDAAASALQCLGYSEYEALPMVWATLEEIVNRVEVTDRI